jgi:hypothetical protein
MTACRDTMQLDRPFAHLNLISEFLFTCPVWSLSTTRVDRQWFEKKKSIDNGYLRRKTLTAELQSTDMSTHHTVGILATLIQRLRRCAHQCFTQQPKGSELLQFCRNNADAKKLEEHQIHPFSGQILPIHPIRSDSSNQTTTLVYSIFLYTAVLQKGIHIFLSA